MRRKSTKNKVVHVIIFGVLPGVVYFVAVELIPNLLGLSANEDNTLSCQLIFNKTVNYYSQACRWAGAVIKEINWAGAVRPKTAKK